MIRTTRPRTRPGFTLVEVLTVILIIGILVGLLLPAIQSAINTAKAAVVTAETNQMAQALTTFKNQYGDYPPSRIILSEYGTYSTSGTTALGSAGFLGTEVVSAGTHTDITYEQLAVRSVRYLRKFFPRMAIDTNGSSSTDVSKSSTTAADWYDFNGDNVRNPEPILLQGHECLAFFLGGMPNSAATAGQPFPGLTGFDKDPRNPFHPVLYYGTATPNRVAGLFEFRADRFLDEDGDNIPGYVDTLGINTDARFYAYFSAYGSTASGGGYDPNDVNFSSSVTTYASTDDDALTNTFRVAFTPNSGTANTVISHSPNPYTTSASLPSGTATYASPQTFQIISAGRDRRYGFGGQYLGSATNGRLPVESSMAGGTIDRTPEQDNLTSFSGGRLD